MPERNPYDFVPLEDTPAVVAAPSLASLSGLSGVIEYRIETLTPLCINQNPSQPNARRVYEFARLGSRPAIPATSLKGMLRSVHEVLTNSAMGLVKSEGRGGWYRRKIPQAFLPGDERRAESQRLTPTEALFGMVGSGKSSVGYAGRVFIDDLPVARLVEEQIARPRGGMPKPEHSSFYFQDGGQGRALGRKFYYHQRSYREVRDEYAINRAKASETRTMQVVPPDELLPGRLRFTGLAESELADLVYTLVLESSLAHKLGYGKPLGLGSLRIQIDHLSVEPLLDGLPARLRRYGSPVFENWTERVPALALASRERWLARRSGNASYTAFSELARWPQQENFLYPDYPFFAGERGKPEKTTLDAYQRRAATRPASPRNTPPVEADEATQGNTTPQQAAPVEPLVRPPPGPPLDLRPSGLVEVDRAAGAFYVRGLDDRRYLILEAELSAEVRQGLVEQLRKGMAPRVRYRSDRRKINGKHQNIALEIELVQEGQH